MDRHISAAAALAAPLLLLAALGTTQAEAAPDTACLSAPNGTAPQGQHWYYRLNRTSGQKCWYLRAPGSAQPKPVARTADEQGGRSGSPPKKPERASSSAGRAALASASIEPLANEAATVAPAPAAPQTPSTRQQSTAFGPTVAQPPTAPPWPQPDRPQMTASAVPMPSPETAALASSQPARAESGVAAADPAQPPAPDGSRKFDELKPVAASVAAPAVAADARKQSDVAAVSHTERAATAAENAAVIAAAVLLAGCVCLVGLIARKRLPIYDLAMRRRFYFRSLWRKPGPAEAARADRGLQQISAGAALAVPKSVALRRSLPREPLMNAARPRADA